jgi:hypothetical protein
MTLSDGPGHIVKDSLGNVKAFLAITVGAIVLHFTRDQLVEWHLPNYIVYPLGLLEIVMFFSDFILIFLTVVIFTCKEAHRLLLEVGIDLPRMLRKIGRNPGVTARTSDPPAQKS